MGTEEGRRRVSAVRERLRGRLKGRMEEEVPLAPLTSFRIGGPAELLVAPKGWTDLAILAHALAEEAGDDDADCVWVMPWRRRERISWSWDGGPTCWWPTPASAEWWW